MHLKRSQFTYMILISSLICLSGCGLPPQKPKVQKVETASKNIHLEKEPEGKWVGSMPTYGHFEDPNLEKFFTISPAKQKEQEALHQAFLQWKSKKDGRTYPKWLNQKLQEDKKLYQECKNKPRPLKKDDTTCQSMLETDGYEILVYSDREAPVPSGISEGSFTLDFKVRNTKRAEKP